MQRPVRHEMPTHLFAVGQRVRIKNGMFVQRSAETYLVTAKLPPRGDSLQYRIRHDEERHDRVMTEDGLESVADADAVENASHINGRAAMAKVK